MMVAGMSLEMILSKMVGPDVLAALHVEQMHHGMETCSISIVMVRAGHAVCPLRGVAYPDAAASFAAFSSDIALVCKEPRLILNTVPELLKTGLATRK